MKKEMKTKHRSSPKSPEEYLYSIYRCCDGVEGYGIYRWKLNGLAGEARPETLLFRLPSGEEYPHATAFASIGSKIYLIGGLDWRRNLCSRHIFVVETEKLHTNDSAQIVRKIPSVLQAAVRRRNAAAIGGKIYTFPVHFGHALESPLVPSRFEVFDPVTEESNLLPEPPVRFSHYESSESYISLNRHILLCMKRAGRRWIFAFDTAYPYSGWKDITSFLGVRPSQFMQPYFLPMQPATSLRGHDNDDRSRSQNATSLGGHDESDSALLSIENATLLGGHDEGSKGSRSFATMRLQNATSLGGHDESGSALLSIENATLLGGHDEGSRKGSRSFATVRSGIGLVYHAIFKFEDDPIRIGKFYRISGIPKSMAGRSCFSHGGSVFFAYTDDAPESGIAVWKFKKFSLAYCSDPNRPMLDHYAADEVFSFQVKCPSFDNLLASFVIPASIY